MRIFTFILAILAVILLQVLCWKNGYEIGNTKLREAYVYSCGKFAQRLPGLIYFGYEYTGRNLSGFGYRTSFEEKANEYKSIKDVPWNVWTIEEKMYLCAYGSVGNKLSKEDLNEIWERYGNN